MPVFTCHDYQKRHVTLSQTTWDIHICVRKPWMDGYLGVVRSTIRDPELVCRDADHDDRVVYYSLGRMEDSPNEYMKVVVEYDDDGFGSVVTAFPMRKPKSGESKIWPLP